MPELFLVTIEYTEPDAHESWLEALESITAECVPPEPPEQTVVKRHVAVNGAFGCMAVTDAAALALTAVVGGDEDTWEKYRAIVKRVEHLGPVAVERGQRDG